MFYHFPLTLHLYIQTGQSPHLVKNYWTSVKKDWTTTALEQSSSMETLLRLYTKKRKKKERSSKMLAHCVAFETLLMDFYMENKLIQAFLDIQISFKFCFHKCHSKTQAISLMQICKSTFGASTLFPPQRPCSQLFPLPSLTAAYQLLSTVFPNTV